MDQFLIYRIAIIVILAFIYMAFDVFNKRNVPTIFAYASLVIGVIMTALYYPDLQSISLSAVVVVIVSSLGYVFYRIGQLGAADVIEFAAISMILPVQPAPYLLSYLQFNMPFIVSIFIATGVTALLMIPFYYLPRASLMLKKKMFGMVRSKDLYRGLLMLVAYLAFTAFLIYFLQIGIIGIVLMLLITASSLITTIFQAPITDTMIENIPVSRFEEGDIIALNLMKKSEIKRMKEKIKGFDHLVTLRIIKEMSNKKIKLKFPVYRKAMPLALPIFIAVLISILFGNLILIII